MHLTALIFGVGSIGVATAVKHTPAEWLDYFPTLSESKDDAKLPGRYEEAFQVSKTALLMDDE